MARHSLGPIQLAKFERVNVVGVSGSGKSTFSKQLANLLDSPYLEMDRLYWLPNWQEPSDDDFFAKVTVALEPQRWVLDGNYNRTRDIKWSRTQTIVWLNLSFLRTVSQVTLRCITRAWDKQELWPDTGNHESFRLSFFSRDSVLWYSIRNYHRVQQRYLDVMADPNYAHLNFVRLRTRAEIRKFLDAVQAHQAT